MRVCMAYTGGLTPRKGGGIASVISNVVKHTSEKIEYLLLTICDENEVREIKELYPSTVEIEYVEPVGNVFVGFMRYLAKNLPDFDILHFHDFPFGRDLPLALKSQLRRKNLVYSHHISPEELIRNKLKLGYYYSIFEWFGKIWNRVVANSRFIVNSDLARFRSLHGKICVIRNGVDVEAVEKAKPMRLEGEPSILFVGHLIYRKGIDVLLEAFKLLLSRQTKADPKLHIVGSGILEKACKRYVDNHGLGARVRFWGSVCESMKFGMMKGADVFVLPSRYENSPIVLFEAMAAGKPVVAARVGGIPEVFKQKVNGVLSNPSSKQIAAALKSVCERRQLFEEYGRNNRKAAELFAWKNFAHLYGDLYRSVLA